MKSSTQSQSLNQFQSFTAFKTITNFQCPIHHSQKTNLLCFDSSCQQKGIICSLCSVSQHKNHTIKPIKLILKQIQSDLQIKNSHIQNLAYIDIKQISIKDSINQVQDQKINQLLWDSINKYFEKIKNVIHMRDIQKLSYKIKQFNNLHNNNQCQSQFSYLKKKQNLIFQIGKLLIQYMQANIQDKSPQQSNYNAIIKRIKGDLMDKENSLRQFIKKKNIDQSILQMFLHQNTIKKFKFSEKLKHQKIIITQSGSKATLHSEYDTVVSMIEPELKSNSKKTIKFKILCLPSWISLGICFKDIVKANNYSFPSTDHGTFQVSYDGYSWGHKSSINENYHGWYFNQGDTVTIEFDPKNWTLTYMRNSEQNNKHTLTITPIKGQKIYFCVALNSNDQSVQILDEK